MIVRIRKEIFKLTMLLTAVLMAPSISNAVPAFSRQLNVGCDTCHFQHFPLLNGFGRAFKASGFTMSSGQLIESDHISFPENLNMALFTNIRYQGSNGKKVTDSHNSNDGELLLPAETSLFLGGRVNEHIGALVEGDVGGAGTTSGSAFLASLKLPAGRISGFRFYRQWQT